MSSLRISGLKDAGNGVRTCPASFFLSLQSTWVLIFFSLKKQPCWRWRTIKHDICWVIHVDVGINGLNEKPLPLRISESAPAKMPPRRMLREFHTMRNDKEGMVDVSMCNSWKDGSPWDLWKPAHSGKYVGRRSKVHPLSCPAWGFSNSDPSSLSSWLLWSGFPSTRTLPPPIVLSTNRH